MTMNNEDRIALDNSWREAAARGECTAEECDCNTYDHDEVAA